MSCKEINVVIKGSLSRYSGGAHAQGRLEGLGERDMAAGSECLGGRGVFSSLLATGRGD